MGKAPASQFYWGDWRRDPGIRACNFETRGIWFEMLCIMWESENQGYFVLNGIPPDDLIASRIIGCSVDQYQKSIKELEINNVLSRNCHACKMANSNDKKCKNGVTFPEVSMGMSQSCHGIIYNRRMAREAKIRKGWSVRQARHRERVTPELPKSHTDVTPLSSSSSSNINNNKELIEPVTLSKIEEIPRQKYYKNEFGIFVCSLCQTQFTFYKNLQSHFKKVHK